MDKTRDQKREELQELVKDMLVMDIVEALEKGLLHSDLIELVRMLEG